MTTPSALKTDLDTLFALARQRSYITQEEILHAFVEPEEHIEALDDFYDKILRSSVDIFESVSEEKPEEEVDTLTQELEMISTLGSGGVSDPVRMYLKEIGRIPLLNREEEIRLAQRVEAGEALAKKKSSLM